MIRLQADIRKTVANVLQARGANVDEVASETVSASRHTLRTPNAGPLAYFSSQPASVQHSGDATVPARATPPPPVPPSLANRNALSVVYRVQGAVSLPSDGEEHRLTIATLDFKAKLKYMCVPRQAPTVYIVAKVKNTSEFDLLSGPVNVFMNDSYVTKTAIPVRISFSQPLGQRSIRCI